MPAILLLSLLFFSAFSYAQGITGTWRTVDEHNESKSIVEIYQENGLYYGKVIELLKEPETAICTKCQGDDKDKPVLGMVIIKDLYEKDGKFVGGTVLDPTKGVVYRTKLWIEDGNLQIRGYLGLFFRTQAWYRL